MCTLVIARRPQDDWPVLIAANRDEMVDRPWQPPARHWPERPDIVAGHDELAGGSWLGSELLAADLFVWMGPASAVLMGGALVLMIASRENNTRNQRKVSS